MTVMHPTHFNRTPSPEALPDGKIAEYRKNGFVHVPGVLTPEETQRFREAVLALLERKKQSSMLYRDEAVFTQMVNVWRDDPVLRNLTLHPTISGIAARLAGVPLRLWHDQVLIKQPGKSVPTEFHQDQPGWAHQNSRQPISAWIALVDVPVERGCMTFIPGSQRYEDLPLGSSSTHDPDLLFKSCPELVWDPRVTIPLRAGDCTFHHGRCAHMAHPNTTDSARVAFVVMFMDRDTQYSASRETQVTKSLGLKKGDPLTGELFPEVPFLTGARGS